jgi:hypothetical protein
MRTTSLLARSAGICLLALATVVPSLRAQSLTNGGLRGVVLSAADGSPIPGVEVTLEGPDGRAMAYLEADYQGQFAVPLLAPGTYRVLAEQVGLQPVRYLGVTIVAGQTTAITFRLERRPPPILAVEEVVQPGAPAGTAMGRALQPEELMRGDRYRSATDLSRGVTEIDGPRDVREGYVYSGGGLAAGYNRMAVDGLTETLMRHPGAPGEPASAPLFQRGALAQAQVLGMGFDAEWRGYPGTMLSGHTMRGGNDISFDPYANFASSTLGGDTKDNPADSAAYSYQVGASVSGAIIRDTASFMLRLDYQQLRTPSAFPFDDAGLRAALEQTAENTYGVPLGQALAPVVRTWQGISGMGRLDWRIDRHMVAFRFGYAKWTEDNPLLLDERSNLNGSSLEANDLSGAISITSSWTKVANEIRFGVNSTKRDWLAADLPATSLAAEGVAFGSSAGYPGLFSQRAFDVTDAIQFQLARHRFKTGITFAMTDYKQDYRYGSAGAFTFGGLDAFGRGEGTYFQTVGQAQETANPTMNDWGIFLQDTWTVSPEIALVLGVRWDKQNAPNDQIQFNNEWFQVSGERNDFAPDRDGFAPRAALVWDVQNRGEWIVRGGAGLYHGRVDPAVLSEAIFYDLGTTIRRGQGTFDSWPSRPDEELAPNAGTRLTYFNSTYKVPQAFKASIGVSRNFTGGLALHFLGSYHHTDYLLRRADANRVPVQFGMTQEDRPVYGDLIQQGGLLSPVPGSNRRFDGFDQVHVLSPTGYADYADFTVLLEREVPKGLSYSLSYTFSHTQDNQLGLRSLDPADQLNPFPDGLQGADWSDGRSDFDVPHRAVIGADYRMGAKTPISIGARFRYRSGLPFTPGFQPGVDINGDGAGNNDPAFLDAGLANMSSALTAGSCGSLTNVFAERNSCREDAAYGLDVRFSIGLPVRTAAGSHLALTLDAFNVVSSAVGIVDRALLLVDPNGQLIKDGSGNVTVPLYVNPNFGNLLSRRNDPRMIRVGVRMEY